MLNLRRPSQKEVSMAVLKCQECGYTKGLAEQYVGKSVKCPQCGHATKIYDTALLLTLYSKKVLEIQSELKEVKQVVAEYKTYTAQPVVHNAEEQSQVLNKLYRENRIAMSEFNDATKLRNAMMLRMEQAGTYLMRFSIVGFLVILLLLGFLMMQLVNKTDHLSTQLETIGGGIQASTEELQNIKQVASSLNSTSTNNTVVDPQVTESIQSVQTEIEALNQEMASLNKKLKALSDKYNSYYYPYR
jgi:methyl-accepting chemotaxis protein